MHNSGVTLKQAIYSEITGECIDGWNFNGFSYMYPNTKAEQITFIRTEAIKIDKKGLTEIEARQVINAINNKKGYLKTSAIFNSLGSNN